MPVDCSIAQSASYLCYAVFLRFVFHPHQEAKKAAPSHCYRNVHEEALQVFYEAL